MSADLGNVVNVSLLRQGASIARDNMNVVLIVTADDSVLNTSDRYRSYLNAAAVAVDFGSESDTYQLALAFFGTRPNPTDAGGALLIGYWRAADETVLASSAKLVSEQLSEAVTIGALQSIPDGSLDITIDGTLVTVTGIDGRTITSLEDVAASLNTSFTTADVTLVNNQVIFTSLLTGDLSLMTYATATSSGTFIGNILGLSESSGSLLTQGADEAGLVAESKVDSLIAIRQLVNFKGFMFSDDPTSIEVGLIGAWSQANDALSYDVFRDVSNLAVDINNPVWSTKLNGYTNYRMLYDTSGNRKFAASYMARMHTVNFTAQNSALTMNLKELSGVTPQDHTQTTIDMASTVGLDLYVTFKNVPKLLTSGANDFTDNPYNFLAYVDAVQTDVFNLLGTTATKVAQTTPDVNKIVDQLEVTTEGFVLAGVFAAGTWSSPDRFGNVNVFNRSIEEKGYYWLAGLLKNQPQPDREARKSPVMQGAVKVAGAIHKADIIINLNL